VYFYVIVYLQQLNLPNTIIGINHPRELISVGRDIAYYMQGPEFEPQTSHLNQSVFQL